MAELETNARFITAQFSLLSGDFFFICTYSTLMFLIRDKRGGGKALCDLILFSCHDDFDDDAAGLFFCHHANYI